jgi:hypothetical protein
MGYLRGKRTSPSWQEAASGGLFVRVRGLLIYCACLPTSNGNQSDTGQNKSTNDRCRDDKPVGYHHRCLPSRLSESLSRSARQRL